MVYPKEKFRSRLVNTFVEFAAGQLQGRPWPFERHLTRHAAGGMSRENERLLRLLERLDPEARRSLHRLAEFLAARAHGVAPNAPEVGAAPRRRDGGAGDQAIEPKPIPGPNATA